VARAAQLGYTAMALTDECSVAGVVRAHEEAKRQNEAGSPIQLIIGSSFDVQGEGDTPACRLVLLARHREGYGDLCELISLARLRCAKGSTGSRCATSTAPKAPCAVRPAATPC